MAFVEAMAAGLPAIGSRGEGGPGTSPPRAGVWCSCGPDDAGALAAEMARLSGGSGASCRRLGARGAAGRSPRTSPGSGAGRRPWRRIARRSAAPTHVSDRVDVLVVSLGTTRGLRLADAQLVDMLRAGRRLGGGGGDPDRADQCAAAGVSGQRRGRGDRGAAGVVDGARRHRPRAVVFSTTTAALLAGDSGVPFAVWLDSPARLNRPARQPAAARARAPATRARPGADATQPGRGDGAAGRRRADGVISATDPGGAGRVRRATPGNRSWSATRPTRRPRGSRCCARPGAGSVPGARLVIAGIPRERRSNSWRAAALAPRPTRSSRDAAPGLVSGSARAGPRVRQRRGVGGLRDRAARGTRPRRRSGGRARRRAVPRARDRPLARALVRRRGPGRRVAGARARGGVRGGRRGPRRLPRGRTPRARALPARGVVKRLQEEVLPALLGA